MKRLYPFAPLAAAMGLSTNQAGLRLGLSGSTQQDYRDRGLSERVADRLAVKAGLHPFEVWPEMADHQLATTARCERCEEPIVKVRRNQRWCSKRCRDRAAQATYQRTRWANDPEWAERQRERLRRYRAETAEYQRAQAKVRAERRKAA